MHEDFTDPDLGTQYEFFDPGGDDMNLDGVLSTNGPTYNTIYDFGFYTIRFIHNNFHTYMYFNMKICDLSIKDRT